MGYRITTHRGKTTKSGVAYSAKHLDRHFDLKKAPHIDPARTPLNRYVAFDVDENGILHHQKSLDLYAHELAVYERLFQKRLDEVNENYRKQRHPEKVKTLKQYYSHQQSCPDEFLIYIGDHENHPPSEVLMGAASELISHMQKKYSKNFIPFSIAVHMDEGNRHADEPEDKDLGCHIHFRAAWVATDKHGLKVSITKGMAEAGIELQNAEKGEQKYNNRQMTFSAELRDIFAEILRDKYGLEINTEAKEASQSGKDLATYQRDQALLGLQKATAEKTELQKEVNELKAETGRLKSILMRFQTMLGPLKQLIKKLGSIKLSPNRSVLDDVFLDAKTAGSIEALQQLEEERV